jgi:hypothetical protein
VFDEIEYEWHDVPRFMYYALALGLGVLLIWSPLNFTSIPGTGVVLYVGFATLGVSAVFALLTFPAYYFDGRRVKEASGVEWDPDIRMYVLTSLFLTPYVVGGVYIVRRNRNVRSLDAGKKMV